MINTFQNTMKDITHIPANISTDNTLNSKSAHTTINGYIGTGDSCVVGGSGAAATV